MFERGSLVKISSNTSVNNGRLAIVLYYTKGRETDIVMISLVSVSLEKLQIYKNKFAIRESSLKEATVYDIMRNLDDKDLAKLTKKKASKILSKYLETIEFVFDEDNG